jgi:hypothetical protein
MDQLLRNNPYCIIGEIHEHITIKVHLPTIITD